MSADDRATVEIFLQWVEDGGLAGWIESVMNDANKLKRISEIYNDIKRAFGF